jgi:CO dehydrogenase/acetyl-CoA synthase beta subunit
MLFLSRGKSPSFLIVPGFEEIVQTIHGNIPQVKKPIWLKFAPFDGEGMETPAMPMRRGQNTAQGSLETTVAARVTGLPEDEIVDFLKNHDAYGVEFVAVEDREQEIEDNDEAFLVSEASGYYCQLCDMHLKNAQARAGHRMSNAHKAAFKVVIRAAQESAKAKQLTLEGE